MRSQGAAEQRWVRQDAGRGAGVSVLLSFVTVLAWGTWIPLAQIVPGVSQRSRILHVAVGNVVLAAGALIVGGGQLSLGWRGFWLPLAGGLVWTVGSFAAFRASETIGLARAAGTWTPLNIITAFVWGALLFGELNNFGVTRVAVLVGAFVVMSAGVVMVVRARDTPPADGGAAVRDAGRQRAGLLWATATGVLWGSYFVPAQWAKVPSQVANFPLALGILLAASVLAVSAGEPVRLSRRITALQLAAGLLFGIGNVALLGLVARVGTGAGFTIAQLSLLVNASIGIWVFKVPRPGTRPARIAMVGIVLAGVGGGVIGALR
jgi:glucose uptake protein